MGRSNDDKYRMIGRLMALVFDPDWQRELDEVNAGKVGAPFRYPPTLIAKIAIARTLCGAGYREMEGMAQKLLGKRWAPHYAQIWRRVSTVDVSLIGGAAVARCDCAVVALSIDATGEKVHGGWQWIRDAHGKDRDKDIGAKFTKRSQMVDVDTGMVVAAVITGGNVGDSTVFEQLMDESLRALASGVLPGGVRLERAAAGGGTSAAAGGAGGRSDEGGCDVTCNGTCGGTCNGNGGARDGGCVTMEIEVLGDAAYGNRKILVKCRMVGARPLMTMRVTSTARGKGAGDAWGVPVREQLGGSGDADVSRLDRAQRRAMQAEWKKRVGYGRRWVSEIVFSSFKRLFGEHVRARKWENVRQEADIKTAVYNLITASGGWGRG